MNTLSIIVGFIIGVLANYSFDRLRFQFRKEKGEYLPKILDDIKGWTTSGGEVYFYKKDPDYNIRINPGEDSLAERFKKFPDKEHDKISWVEVKFNDAVLFGWNFMHLDSYRYLVPVPKTQLNPADSYYDYYDFKSLEIKVFTVIGSANLMPNESKIDGLKRIAEIVGIEVTDS